MRTYPNNFEAEKSLLSCVLIDGAAASEICATTTPDYFFNEQNKRVFEAIKKLSAKNMAIDAVTVNDQMEADKSAGIDTLDYLINLSDMTPSAANHKDYYNLLRRDYMRRKCIEAAKSIAEKAYGTEDEKELISFAEKEVFELSASGEKRGDLEHASIASAAFLQRIDDIAASRIARGLQSGFKRLDNTTHGLCRGDLIILAARPSVGKTSLAIQIVSNLISKKSKAVAAIFSLEMPAIQLAQRIMAQTSGVGMDDLSGAKLSESQLDKVFCVHSLISESMVYIDDTAMQTPSKIFSKCRKLSVKEGKIDLVIIDYLQLMAGDRSGRENKNIEVSDISRMMKLLAREMNCPVMVLSQMSRDIEKRGSNKDKEDGSQRYRAPMLSDLRDSGSIEQDADIVLFLSRENESDKLQDNYTVVLDIAKNRNGALGSMRLNWEGKFTRFTEIP